MATQGFFALVGVKIQQVFGVLVGGAANAGAIPALNAQGTIDVTMLPPGVGISVSMATASEALAAGALVNVWNNAGVPSARNADGSTQGKEANGYVITAFAANAVATVYAFGANGMLTGLTPGPLYLSATTPGGVSATPASAVGQTYQRVGTASSPTSFEFFSGQPFLL